MKRLWIISLGFALLSACASKPIYSSSGLIDSAKQDLKSANALAGEVKDTFNQYLGAHKHMLKTKSLEDKDKMRSLHELMKVLRTEAKAIFILRKEIRSDLASLEEELEGKPSVSEGSESYKKVERQVKLYGMGNPHPGLKMSRDNFEKAFGAYTSKLSEFSGYLTNKRDLNTNFVRNLKEIFSRLDKISAQSQGDKSLLNRIAQIKLQLSDLQAEFTMELPEKSQTVLLFPDMISYSVMDRLSAVGEQLNEIKTKKVQ